MDRDSELSTEDLARPSGARQDERPTPETAQEQLPREPGADDAIRDGGATSASPQGRDGAPAPVARDVESGGSADLGEADAAEAGQPGQAGWNDESPSRGGGEGGMTTNAGGQPASQDTPPAGRPAGDVGAGDVALLSSADGDRFRQRWGDVQARFVDDPQEAVSTADALVAELMQSLARGFSEHKGALEAQWQSGGNPDTEELRQALQRYRSFFDRLLST